MAKKEFEFVEGRAREDLRGIIKNEQAQNGGTHPTVIIVSVALCPTTRCTKHC